MAGSMVSLSLASTEAFSRAPSNIYFHVNGRDSVKRLSVSRPRVGLSSTLSFPAFSSVFFNAGVGALEISTMQFIFSDNIVDHQHNGGALGAQMNIFQRVGRVLKSYANAIISAAEDPEKILDQTVLEMSDDLTKMRQASAQVLASQKKLENRYISTKQAADDWYRRAKLALEKGDDNLAREALKRRKDYEDNANALKSQLDQQKNVVEKLITNTRLLESKMQEAKSKKDTLKARAQSAKTAQKVNEMLGNVNTSSALSAFERMEEKVMTLESEAEALNQLSTDDLEGKFALLESSSVDEDVASLKKDMLGKSKKGELPPGRTSVSNPNADSLFRDIEIEKELSELRRKTQEL
eukprot:Gb_32562 [translate_table: standard]